MLDPEYVKRIDCEMEESGGQLAPDDHEGVWANLRACHQWAAELEFAIALLTDTSLDEVREMTLNKAAERHPTLSREEALKAEIQIRDSLRRAAETRNLWDQCARMQRHPATLIEACTHVVAVPSTRDDLNGKVAAERGWPAYS